MRSWVKQWCVLIGSAALLGCAASGSGEQASGTKVAATNCMGQAQIDLQACQAKCPTASGNEHFSIQHKIAVENSECMDRCGEVNQRRSMECKVKS